MNLKKPVDLETSIHHKESKEEKNKIIHSKHIKLPIVSITMYKRMQHSLERMPIRRTQERFERYPCPRACKTQDVRIHGLAVVDADDMRY